MRTCRQLRFQLAVIPLVEIVLIIVLREDPNLIQSDNEPIKSLTLGIKGAAGQRQITSIQFLLRVFGCSADQGFDRTQLSFVLLYLVLVVAASQRVFGQFSADQLRSVAA